MKITSSYQLKEGDDIWYFYKGKWHSGKHTKFLSPASGKVFQEENFIWAYWRDCSEASYVNCEKTLVMKDGPAFKILYTETDNENN